MPTLKSPLKSLILALALALPLLPSTTAAQETPVQATEETAIFAGGCFWCVESDFDPVPGVLTTTSGYIGGHLDNPTYKQVSKGGTGHIESVRITFDPSVVSYEKLLHLFWRSVDPTDAGGQFCDRGESYQTTIFTTSDEQATAAEASKAQLLEDGIAVVTPIRAATQFFDAEDYHQNYYHKSPVRYKYYRYTCGRDKKVKALWGDEAWAKH